VATADNVSTYTGTTGSGAYFWGAQAEQPVVASSYIPTTTVAVTRANELITANSVAFINATAGTVYAVFNVSNSGSPRILGRNSGGVSVLYLNGLTNFADFPTANNLQAANTYTAGTNGKGAASYAATARSIVLNGGTVAVDNVNGIGTFDSFQLGADVGGGNYLNGYLRNISYWNTRLSDAAIQTLTT
jgi:hypothetical protein